MDHQHSPSEADLQALERLIEARFEVAIRPAIEERDQGLHNLSRTAPGLGAWFLGALKVYENYVTRLAAEWTKCHRLVADDFGDQELRSKPSLDRLREKIMRQVGFACGAVRDAIESRARAAGDGFPLPQEREYAKLESKARQTANLEIAVLDAEGDAFRGKRESGSGTARKKRRYGPKADLENHGKVADVVREYGDGWKSPEKMPQVCKDLDKLPIPRSKRWAEWTTRPRTWKQAYTLHPERVVKVIQHKLDQWEKHATGS